MRLFKEHLRREVQDLNGVWSFRIDENDVGESEGWEKELPNAQSTVVPSMWNNETGLLNYVGVAWYQKKFYSKGGTLRFCFGGVMTLATIWLDGEKLGKHYGGFCEFSFIKRGVQDGWHTLTIRADNRFDEDSIPQKRLDWWHYGGITRDVYVERLHGISALWNQTAYTLDEKLEKASVTQNVEIYNAEDKEIADTLTLTFGALTMQKAVRLQAGESATVQFAFTVEDVRLWNVGAPYLYDFCLKTTTDDLYDRTGFRLVEVKPDGVYLNGEFCEIRGVNRQEEHPEWGFAFPLKLMKKDLDIVLDMGCNAIRGAHYPNSQVFVDYCDETGMLFWSEIPIWGGGFSIETLAREKVLTRGLAMHEEQVRYYYNHPSIIIWGMHNEICSESQPGYEMSKLYYNYLKENGGNRIVTYASNRPMEDISFEFCDLICINLYKGWYDGDISTWDTFLSDFRTRRENLGLTEKPVILSEFGAAGLYGYHTFDDIRWTEEYQAKLLAYCLDLFHNDTMVCGFYIWQFADIRTGIDINRARGFNNKGILNEYRKPKLAYHAVRERYRKYAEEDNRKKGK